MCAVTKRALDYLNEALGELVTESLDSCFRISTEAEGALKVGVSTPEEGDTTFEHRDSTVLAISSEVMDVYSSMTLDVDDQKNLVLR